MAEATPQVPRRSWRLLRNGLRECWYEVVRLICTAVAVPLLLLSLLFSFIGNVLALAIPLPLKWFVLVLLFVARTGDALEDIAEGLVEGSR